MSQFLSQIPRQLLQQQQRMMPQLIQAMDILQLNALALESRIEQEMDSNPALEIAEPEPELLDDGQKPDEQPAESTEEEQAMIVKEDDSRDDFERLDNLVSEYGWGDDEFEYRGTKSRARVSEEGDIKLEAMANTAARPIGLQEHLMGQWSFVDINDDTRRIGAAIIDSIDEIGRLSIPLARIATELEPAVSLEDVAEALEFVQELDPAGIAARTLQESLLLQLARLPDNHELAEHIIADHFEDLQKNRLPSIAKALRVPIEEVKAALPGIARLSLHPGVDAVDRPVPSIVPDILVEYNDAEDEYEVRLTRGNLRELRISPEFREALERSRGDKKAREFIKKKIEAANAIIDAVKYRRERLLEVAIAVVEAQRDFLDRGELHLKVLRMSDLAAELGCDPSTISRTVDEKYMQTPRGIYPLRRFFTGGTTTGNGEVLGWASIKAKVQDIVDAEDKRDPLSDDAIVEKLKIDGIEIKRRTVAKYRSQLVIPTARQRRQY